MAVDQTREDNFLKELLGNVDPKRLESVMPVTGGVITMIFTDIVNSTGIKAEMGDRRFFETVLEPHNKLIRACISHHKGQELKTIGDAFFAGFRLPTKAVECAVEIQRSLDSTPIETSRGPLQVRIGVHSGIPEVYRDSVSNRVDLSGTDVDRAARVEARVAVHSAAKAALDNAIIARCGWRRIKRIRSHRCPSSRVCTIRRARRPLCGHRRPHRHSRRLWSLPDYSRLRWLCPPTGLSAL